MHVRVSARARRVLQLRLRLLPPDVVGLHLVVVLAPAGCARACSRARTRRGPALTRTALEARWGPRAAQAAFAARTGVSVLELLRPLSRWQFNEDLEILKPLRPLRFL